MQELILLLQRDLDEMYDKDDWDDPEVVHLWNKLQHLLRLARELHRIHQKRHALILCVNFLTRVLQTWPRPLPGLDRLAKITTLPLTQPDTDDEVQELPAHFSSAMRLEDPKTTETPVQPLRPLVDLVRRGGRKDGGWFEGPRLLYRVHRPSSHTFYHQDAGFCCAAWHRGMYFDKPSKWDFIHHASGHQSSSSGVFETPYISMTSSPTRAMNLVPSNEIHSAEVFVIDAGKLWATSIEVERTTDIANRHGIIYRGRGLYGRVHYITDTHWVALYWIPADCIVKRMRFHQFQRLCNYNALFRGTDYFMS